MAFSQAQIDGLKAAIAAGILTAEYEGKRVTYQSMDAMLQALALAEEAVANQSADGAVTYSLATHNRD